MSEVFEYKQQGRRPSTVTAAVLCLVALGFAAYHGAPWSIWAIWGASSLLVAYMVICNPVSGMRLSDTEVTFSPHARPLTVTLRDIDTIIMTDWSDGTSAALKMRSGAHHQLSSSDFPDLDIFEAQMRTRAVTVLRR